MERPSLKYLAALYWTEDEIWYGVPEREDEYFEYTEADIEFERRRALQESMDRRN